MFIGTVCADFSSLPPFTFPKQCLHFSSLNIRTCFSDFLQWRKKNAVHSSNQFMSVMCKVLTTSTLQNIIHRVDLQNKYKKSLTLKIIKVLHEMRHHRRISKHNNQPSVKADVDFAAIRKCWCTKRQQSVRLGVATSHVSVWTPSFNSCGLICYCRSTCHCPSTTIPPTAHINHPAPAAF